MARSTSTSTLLELGGPGEDARDGELLPSFARVPVPYSSEEGNDPSARIRELNDAFRTVFAGHPPTRKAHCGTLVSRIGLGLRPYANSPPVAAMPSPFMDIWDATFNLRKRRRAAVCMSAASMPTACILQVC